MAFRQLYIHTKVSHQNQYNLRNWTDFDVPEVRTVNHEIKIWQIVPINIKKLGTIDKFKIFIKNRKQRLVYVDYVTSIYKIHPTNRLEHEFVALFSHII